MAITPTRRTVRIGAMPAARVQADVSANAFGAQAGAAASRFGDATTRVAGQAMDLMTEEAIRENEARAREGDAALSTSLRGLLFDPERGFFNQRGQHAIDGRAGVEAALDAEIARIAETIPTSRGRELFMEQATRRHQNALVEIERHTSGELRAWEDTAADARIAAATDDAIAAYSRPDLVRHNINVAEAEVYERARRNGWPAERTNQALAEARSTVHRGIVTRLLNDGDEAAALRYYQANQEHLTGADAAGLSRAIGIANDGVAAADALARARGEASFGGGSSYTPPTVGTSDYGAIQPGATFTEASPGLVAAVVQQESGGNPLARGGDDEYGLMQILPSTARSLARQMGDADGLAALAAGDAAFTEYMMRPDVNQRYGTFYLNQMLRRYGGDMVLALTAYNAGPGNTDNAIARIGDPRTGAVTHQQFLDHVGNGEYARGVINHAGRLSADTSVEVRPLPPLDRAAPFSGRVIAYGDSIGVGVGDLAGVEGHAVGSSGHINGNLPDLPDIQPGDRVIYSVGSNDAAYVTGPNGIDREIEFETAVRSQIEQIQAAGGEAVIVGLNREYEGGRFQSTDDLLRSIADETGARYLSHTGEGLAADGLHFTPGGYGTLRSRAMALFDGAADPPTEPTPAEPSRRQQYLATLANLEVERDSGLISEDVYRAAVAQEERDYQQDRREEAVRVAEAVDQALAMIDRGGNPPATLLARLPREDYERVQEYAAAQGEIRTDPEVLRSLYDLMSIDQAAFARVNLHEHVTSLDREDFRFLQQQQNSIRSAGGDEANFTQLFSSARTLARSALLAANIDTTPEAGSDEAASLNSFYNALYGEIRDMVATGQSVDGDAINRRIEMLLAQIDIRGGGDWFGLTDGDAGPLFGLTPEQIQSGEAFVPFDEIPIVARNEIIAILTERDGEPPSERAVEDLYFQGLLRGVGP